MKRDLLKGPFLSVTANTAGQMKSPAFLIFWTMNIQLA